MACQDRNNSILLNARVKPTLASMTTPTFTVTVKFMSGNILICCFKSENFLQSQSSAYSMAVLLIKQCPKLFTKQLGGDPKD